MIGSCCETARHGHRYKGLAVARKRTGDEQDRRPAFGRDCPHCRQELTSQGAELIRHAGSDCLASTRREDRARRRSCERYLSALWMPCRSWVRREWRRPGWPDCPEYRHHRFSGSLLRTSGRGIAQSPFDDAHAAPELNNNGRSASHRPMSTTTAPSATTSAQVSEPNSRSPRRCRESHAGCGSSRCHRAP